MEKRIESIKLPISELRFDFGNPRKITRKKKAELKESLERFGNWAVYVIDDKKRVISGNQRGAIELEEDPTRIVDCKMLYGYTEAELKAINIKANTHAGEWDLNKLAEWTADLNLDLGFEIPVKDPNEEVRIKDMELIRYEKYNYVMLVCKNEYDFMKLLRDMDLEDKKVIVCPTKNGYRRINARAVWFDDYDITITPKKR